MPPLTPDRTTVLRALREGCAVPLALPVDADEIADPHTLFAQLATGTPRWLLESARRHPTAGRYTYLGWAPRRVVENASLEMLRALLTRHPIRRIAGLPPFIGGAIGYLSYEYRHAFERLSQRTRCDIELPDNTFALYDTILAFDHWANQLFVITLVVPDGAPARRYADAVQRLETLAAQVRACPCESSPVVEASRPVLSDPHWSATMDRDQFTRMVDRALRYIKAGDIYQANLSMRWMAETRESPWAIYERLQRINPSPYAAFGELDETAIVSCSPELLLRVRGRDVATRPIAGTRPRGATPADDLAQSLELILSDKERAEHLMLVDLERNDLGRVCRYGSVAVDELMTLEEYSHVIHIVSNVRGELQASRDWADALAALFPGGTITGCPKIRAMEIIDELEPTARGLYTGSLGWVSYTGDCDFNIAIRTMIVENGHAHIQAGAGIVADSQPAREYAEVQTKAQALLEALQPAPPRAVEASVL